MSFPCPHCGGEIIVTPGPAPLPGWRNPAQPGATGPPQSGAIVGAIPAANSGDAQIAHGSQEPSTKRARAYNQGYDQRFLSFWKLYPLHRDKRKAAKAWRNAVARLTQSLGASPDAIAAIEAGAIRYRDDPNRVPQFTKYAEGWLNADGWEDEPLPTRMPSRNGRPEEPRRALGRLASEIELEEEMRRG